MMIDPKLITDLIGIVLIAFIVVLQYGVKKEQEKPVAA
jgi:hypothetical protein